MLLKNETVASLRKCIEDHYMLEDELLVAPYEASQPDESMSQGKLLQHISKNNVPPTSGNNNPWNFNPRHFNSVLISKLACLKALEHALRGGNLEVMGMLVGTTLKDQFVVFDSFELPVEGTETRVNAQTESYEYMVQYVDEMLPRNLNIVGWYHSHPGYDCWLSNVDMHTQQLNQNFQDPYLAIVVDPHKSLKERRLSIGAFRTIQMPNSEEGDDSLEFYELKISIFDSELDASLDSSKLKFAAPIFDVEAQTLLINRLLDTMRQCNTFNKMSQVLQSNEKPSDEVDEANPESPWCALKTERSSKRCQQAEALCRRTRSNSFFSVTSNDDESDVDMDNRQLGDMDSVSSSVHTMTDPAVPIRRQMQTSLPTLRKLWVNSEEMNFAPRADSTIRKTDDQATTLHNETLRADYVTNKNELLGLKLKEYQQLRFFKDIFTL